MDNQTTTEAEEIRDHVVHIAMDFSTEANHIDIVQQIVAQQIGGHVSDLFGFMSKTDQQYIREAVQRARRKAALKAVEAVEVKP